VPVARLAAAQAAIEDKRTAANAKAPAKAPVKAPAKAPTKAPAKKKS
jgi:hypothetical protein